MKQAFWIAVVGVMFVNCHVAPAASVRSAEPLRTVPPPRMLPLPQHGVLVVDGQRGDDNQAGSVDQPLRSLAAALERVLPGGTVCLRGGTYYGNHVVAVAGREDAPITIRAYPGERAILDGAIREFFDSPGQAWEPVPDGAPGEFQSARTFRNLYQPIGSFGDSMLGLQTYYHAIDLRAQHQLIHFADFSKRRDIDHDPLYCGPGMWFDPDTGRIHVRLAHTSVEGITNYSGATDPRLLPLVIAPFASVPLTVQGARHVVLQDLVIRGGGYDTVKLNLAEHITFDHVVIWAGTYGIRAQSTQHLRIIDSAVHGNVAPWTFRSDTSKRDYPGKPTRNITRLNTHALLVIDNGREHDVYATPVNDHWEIAYSAWTDAHDGPYIGGINIRFHHNLVENTQDDGLYLSQVYPRHLFARDWPTVSIHENVFRQVNMPIAFGAQYVASENQTQTYICRNIFDQRFPLNYSRPTTENPQFRPASGGFVSDHGSPPWAPMFVYHNTLISAARQRQALMNFETSLNPERPRRVFNNIFYHGQAMPIYPTIDPAQNIQADGNLYWSAVMDDKQQAAFFTRFRRSPQFEQSKSVYEPGFAAHAVLADPRFVKMQIEPVAGNDYRLTPDSPAVNAGVAIPAEWLDPLREADAGAPDIGALPLGAPMFHVGPRSQE